jgi:hypothetical protein
MAAMTGQDGLPGWHAIAGNATAWPSSARLARAELRDWGHAPEPSPADRGWLAVEAAAAALLARGDAWPEGQGADEALCRLWATAGGGLPDMESVRRWWALAGRDACPRATRLLVTCDAGGQLLEEPRLEERPGPEPVSLS